jgi:uncharacterized membrane protein YdbT with pleckstrin-like domain
MEGITMDTVVLRPSSKYLLKLVLGILIGAVWFPVLAFAPKFGGGIAAVLLAIYLTLSLVSAVAYWLNLRYEITADEVIVYSGVLTKTVRHVPFRTVTNIEVRRDLVDRIFGIGMLSIQTAGYSGIKSPEERLVGLPNTTEVYEYVANELRRFRGGMSPTQAGEDVHRSVSDQQLLQAILNELHAIRVELQRR